MDEAKQMNADVFMSFQLFNEGSLYQEMNHMLVSKIGTFRQKKKTKKEESKTIINS